MTNRSFIAAVAAVAALALLVLMNNVREATAPVFGPPNVDKGKVMSMVKSGELSFKEARFYVVEGAASPDANGPVRERAAAREGAASPEANAPVRERAAEPGQSKQTGGAARPAKESR